MKLLILAALALPLSANASKIGHPAEAPPKPVSQSSSVASSASTSQSASEASSEATSNSGGNTLSTSYTEARQAPAVAQGSIAIVGCGAGGNLGGSNTNGAAFLGFAYTPYHCQLLQAAQAYQAQGQVKAACELTNLLPAVQRAAKKGFVPPQCTDPPPPVIAPEKPPVVVNVEAAKPPEGEYVTRQELIERERRQTERLTAK